MTLASAVLLALGAVSLIWLFPGHDNISIIQSQVTGQLNLAIGLKEYNFKKDLALLTLKVKPPSGEVTGKDFQLIGPDGSFKQESPGLKGPVDKLETTSDGCVLIHFLVPVDSLKTEKLTLQYKDKKPQLVPWPTNVKRDGT